LEDLALDVVGRTVARVSVEEHMANYQAARARGKSSAKKGDTKSAVKNGAKRMRCEPHLYFMAGGLGSRLGRSA
jgi:hypothetical protein